MLKSRGDPCTLTIAPPPTPPLLLPPKNTYPTRAPHPGLAPAHHVERRVRRHPARVCARREAADLRGAQRRRSRTAVAARSGIWQREERGAGPPAPQRKLASLSRPRRGGGVGRGGCWRRGAAGPHLHHGPLQHHLAHGEGAPHHQAAPKQALDLRRDGRGGGGGGGAGGAGAGMQPPPGMGTHGSRCFAATHLDAPRWPRRWRL
jgi:hypothetical protein